MMKSYRDLKVWQDSIDLVESVYRLSAGFPRSEIYGLTSQLRRCAVSVPSNIAEGHARDSTNEFLHRISISMGSLAELDTQLIIASRLEYLPAAVHSNIDARCLEVGKMLRGLQNALKRKIASK